MTKGLLNECWKYGRMSILQYFLKPFLVFLRVVVLTDLLLCVQKYMAWSQG